MRSLIPVITQNTDVAEFLRWPCDFELDRGEHVEEVHLASGATLDGFAGDGSGGTFFFCGDGGEERPVLYADSEGSAALIAIGLPELLQLLLVTPWWQDCPDFTAEQSAEAATEYLEDMPDFAAQRDRVAAALGLTLPSEADVLARLREVATGPGKDFVLIYTPEGNAYEPLISA